MSTIDLVFEKSITNSTYLNYVTFSMIYPTQPSTLFATMRGDENTAGGLSTFDVSDPGNPVLLDHYTACWGEPLFPTNGGLAAFDVSTPSDPKLISQVINSELIKSNRVWIQGDYAFLPLEVDPGGVGIVDISDSSKLASVKDVTDIQGVKEPYALAIKEDYLYVFGSETNTMAIMRIVEDGAT